jgi:rRNA-processing protein EBP2
MDWIERMDVTVRRDSMKKLEKQFNELENNKENEDMNDLTNNDFKRESLFLKQAELAVADSLPKLEKLKIKTKRPEDYFAEMAKSDEHMKRVREHLLSKHAEMERRDKVRKLRELKKMGKQIQVEAIKKKEKAKKAMNDKVNRYKKGDKTDNLDILLDEDDDKKGKKRKFEGESNGNNKSEDRNSKDDGKMKK